ncbi:hypothetical protein [Streptomyces sp. NPDC057552]|uniref:hypothetical protein n=1 Tax=Streptomyces sp. NPDC057552 TaxID=3350537 RepID=UPI0036CFB72E
MKTSFELKEVVVERGRCWSGPFGNFGDVEVLSPADIGPTNGAGAKAQGSAIPAALLVEWSIFQDKPRLAGAQLWLEARR